MLFETQIDGQLKNAAQEKYCYDVLYCMVALHLYTRYYLDHIPGGGNELWASFHPFDTTFPRVVIVVLHKRELKSSVPTLRWLTTHLGSLLLFLPLKECGSTIWVKGNTDCREGIFIATADAGEKAIANILWLIVCSAFFSFCYILWDKLPKLNISKCWDYKTLVIKSLAI